MSDFKIKVGNTGPPIAINCGFLDGTNQDLTGATVKFAMWNRRTKAMVINEVAAVIVGAPTNGNVAYYWQSADVANEGLFGAEVRVTDAAGKKLTFPSFGWISIRMTHQGPP